MDYSKLEPLSSHNLEKLRYGRIIYYREYDEWKKAKLVAWDKTPRKETYQTMQLGTWKLSKPKTRMISTLTVKRENRSKHLNKWALTNSTFYLMRDGKWRTKEYFIT